MRISTTSPGRLLFLSVLLFSLVAVFGIVALRSASGAPQSAETQSADGIWEQSETQLGVNAATRVPASARSFRLNRVELSRVLAKAPRDNGALLPQSATSVFLPLPRHGFARFQIEESSVFAPELAARHPEIRSYRGRSIDNPSLWVRFDSTPQGFHATVASPEETFVIHPANDDPAQYVVYLSGDDAASSEEFACQAAMPEGGRLSRSSIRSLAGTNAIEATASGPTLRTLRIAIATTQEYTNSFGGGTVSGTLSSINTWLNGLNLVYEREMAVRLVLVANNSTLISSSEPDPYSNGDTGSMIEQSRASINNLIGASSYDIGHVLGAWAGSSAAGRAYIGVVCWDAYKGGGATVIGQSYPLGSSSIIGVLAHEIGHQLGADHSFNAYCGNNRAPGSAWESGSGLTIMSYGGNCSPDVIVFSRSMHFHSGSIAEMNSYLNGSCATLSATGNSAPVVSAGADYTIPRSTPFTLTASASDADPADQGSLTYSWEEIDAGGISYLSPPYSDAGDPSGTTRPIFRPFAPTASPSRTFPSLTYILNNANTPPATVGSLQTAEFLPTVSRQLNFNCVVRDGHGGTSVDGATLTVASSGPFQLTLPNGGESISSGATQTITWNVNSTNLAPVSCTQVKITLSTDGGQTFPVVLAASTPNDGAESVTIPANQAGSAARIKIEALNNVFFDVSDANFSLTPANSCHAVTSLGQQIGYPGGDVYLTGVNFTGVTSVTFGGGVNASFSILSSTSIRATVPAGAASGPIKVSKPSCSDSFSPNFTVSSSPPATLLIDDGGYESAYTAGGYAVNRLTPTAYPATLAAVSIYFGSFTGVQPGMSIQLLVGTNTDGDTNIDNTNFQAISTTVQAVDQFNVYSVPSLTISSGDFVVGFRYFPTSGVYPVVFDRTSPQGRSYASSDGIVFFLQDNYGSTYAGNAGIRATVFQGPQGPSCTPAISPTSLNFSSAGGSGTVNVTATAGCTWSSQSNLSWVQITSGAGNGNGTASFAVAPNGGTARSGIITVAGNTVLLRQGANFADVAAGSIFFEFIGKVSAAGITLGCGQDQQGNPLFCPGQLVTREQMAAFIIRALGDFNPSPPEQQRFVDVPPSSGFYAFIEQMAVRNITLGCNAQGPMYCPTANVTREQMAAFLIRALGDFNPQTPAQQRFADVPPNSIFYAFIDQMAVRGITLGCDAQGTLYCPSSSVTREQMAAFLVRGFGL